MARRAMKLDAIGARRARAVPRTMPPLRCRAGSKWSGERNAHDEEDAAATLAPKSTLERSPPLLPVPQRALPRPSAAPRSFFLDILFSFFRAEARAAVNDPSPGPPDVPQGNARTGRNLWAFRVTSLPRKGESEPPHRSFTRSSDQLDPGGYGSPRAPAVSACARGRGRARRGRALTPRRPRRRDDAARQAALEARSRRDRPPRRAGCPTGSVLISATNGKTTTTAMVGGDPAAAGAPRPQQLRARTSSPVSRRRCSPPAGATLGLFEVDEAALPEVARRVRPKALLLGNLFRDQLDRYGELELLAARWRVAVAGACPTPCSSLNGDDPQIGDLARVHAELRSSSASTTRGHARPALQHAADSKYCLRCGTPYVYAAAYVGHLGDYRCPSCGTPRPALDVAAREIELRRPRRLVVHASMRPTGPARVELRLPGLYNVYNALGAAALGARPRRAAGGGRRPVSSGSRPRSGASSGSRSATAAS